MQALSFGRSGVAQTALVSLLTLAAVATLGAVLAYWTWAWFAPRPVPRLEPAAAQGGSVAAAGAIFGSVPRTQAAAPTGIAIKLLGVVAASGGRRGYAVVQLEAKQIMAVHEGEDVAPGIRLAEVHPDHVLLERNGAREKLAFPERVAGAARALQTPVQRAAQTGASAAAQRSAARTTRSKRRGADNE